MNILFCSFRPKDLNILISRIKWALNELDEDEIYDLHIDTHKTARSLDANAYCWVLMGQIAEKVGTKKEAVYKDEILNLGGNYDTVCVQQKAVDALCKHWQHKGLGWLTETFDSKLPGCVNVNLYYGSSSYDVQTMNRLIDNVVQDAQALGIETKTPRELALLKEDWGERVAKAEHPTNG